jgi:hypothetical protein
MSCGSRLLRDQVLCLVQFVHSVLMLLLLPLVLLPQQLLSRQLLATAPVAAAASTHSSNFPSSSPRAMASMRERIALASLLRLLASVGRNLPGHTAQQHSEGLQGLPYAAFA